MGYMDEKISLRAGSIHTLLTAYNGLVVLLLAGFITNAVKPLALAMGIRLGKPRRNPNVGKC